MSRLAIRTRVALLYSVTFAAATGALLVGLYLLVARGQLFVTPAQGPPGTEVESKSTVLVGLLRASGLMLVVGAVIAVGIGWVVAGRVLAPISRITATASRIASGNLHERVALDGPNDELKHLADTFDGMVARLETAFEAQRRFTANASHELLTPLAISQAILDVAAAQPDACDVRELTGKLLAVNLRSERLVDALLVLARAEHGVVEGRARPGDLAAITHDALELTGGEAAERDVVVRMALEPAVVLADRALLEQLTTNLLLNAIRHNRPGGEVEVSVGAQSGAAVLTVANTGPAVAPEVVDRLFEPFARADPRTRREQGHGLGLAVVRAIGDAHGATVTARANPAGGLTVTAVFPGGTAEGGGGSRRSHRPLPGSCTAPADASRRVATQGGEG